MDKELKITCPDCGVILVVDRITGKVLETRKPIIEQSTGDRFADAILKVKKDKEKITSTKFDDLKKEQDKKRKISEEIFKTSLKEEKKDNNIKPHSIFEGD
ncbi:MAG: hypothetical protein HZA00_10605 [Nitrospinae bacterium]|nr:hypothetical protein [Nitrospinota bacterium]